MLIGRRPNRLPPAVGRLSPAVFTVRPTACFVWSCVWCLALVLSRLPSRVLSGPETGAGRSWGRRRVVGCGWGDAGDATVGRCLTGRRRAAPPRRRRISVPRVCVTRAAVRLCAPRLRHPAPFSPPCVATRRSLFVVSTADGRRSAAGLALLWHAVGLYGWGRSCACGSSVGTRKQAQDSGMGWGCVCLCWCRNLEASTGQR